MNDKCCRDCPFWARKRPLPDLTGQKDRKVGECRFNVPSMPSMPSDLSSPAFPKTTENQWCRPGREHMESHPETVDLEALWEAVARLVGELHLARAGYSSVHERLASHHESVRELDRKVDEVREWAGGNLREADRRWVELSRQAAAMAARADSALQRIDARIQALRDELDGDRDSLLGERIGRIEEHIDATILAEG